MEDFLLELIHRGENNSLSWEINYSKNYEGEYYVAVYKDENILLASSRSEYLEEALDYIRRFLNQLDYE